MRPWLFAILRNVCRGLRRPSVEVTAATEDDEAAAPLWSEAADTPEGAVLRRCDVETIRGLLAALPDAYREVVVLREIHDLSYREIAEVVDVPVGTVMSRLARARAELRAAWMASEGEEPT
jgi:RNA polymerase sigma-70 factor (ECF subfamily)